MSVSVATPAVRTHEQNLDRLAEVAVRVGLGLRTGQELVMTASLDALPLARKNHRAGLSRRRFAGDDALYRR